MIDLSSDTATRPGPGMRAAMAEAIVGDDQKRADPTVNELEARVAALLGHEAALFVPTATMANQIALRLHGEPGDELLAEENSHVLLYELGGAAVFSGLVMRGLPARAGRFTPEQIRAAVRRGGPMHMPRTRIVVVEDTHNSSGGRVWPLEELDAIRDTCRDLGLRLHLDGSRLLNAAVAQDVPAARLGSGFDTVTLCLSKGLGCPLGALLAGSRELMETARRFKHLFGGAMRQAGVVAAAGIYALENNVERLADDHLRARRLAEAWADAGLAADPERTETNFVHVDVSALGLSTHEAIARAVAAGVEVSGTVRPGLLRAVTHLDITDEDVEVAAQEFPRALRALAPV